MKRLSLPFKTDFADQPFRPFARIWRVAAAMLLISGMALSTAWAQTPPAPAPAAAADPLADRMHRLTQDLRCLVCQNESLADSHAPLAMDLKREIRSLMAQGQSDAQIRDFLTQRYGDFVNYQPPLRAGTLLLWAGPLLLLAAGGWLVWRTVRASQRTQSHAPGQAGAPPQAASVGDGPSASPHLTEPSEQAPAEPGANTSANTGANTGANSGADTGAASHGGGDGGDGGGGGGGD